MPRGVKRTPGPTSGLTRPPGLPQNGCMEHEMESLKPVQGAAAPLRRRLTLKGEFALAGFPTAVVLLVLLLVEILSNQRLLYASLASSAFLIYLDPHHGTNTIRTLIFSQLLAASIGFVTYTVTGPEYQYLSAGSAMVLTIVLMILFDIVHPPAVSTSLAFAFRSGNEQNYIIFLLAVGITAVLVIIQRAAVWILGRHHH